MALKRHEEGRLINCLLCVDQFSIEELAEKLARAMRDMAYVLRANGETMEPERFSAWAAKAIACIGKLPETLTDRSIEIRLQRRIKIETITPLRDAAPETFERLPRQLWR